MQWTIDLNLILETNKVSALNTPWGVNMSGKRSGWGVWLKSASEGNYLAVAGSIPITGKNSKEYSL